jgi:acyl-coenzyme A synthetase/AMP-(fatty) acid ligase
LEHLGRIDSVKVRGFRVDVGEVESVLAGHPELTAAAVVASDPAAEMQLIAYHRPESVLFSNGH